MRTMVSQIISNSIIRGGACLANSSGNTKTPHYCPVVKGTLRWGSTQGVSNVESVPCPDVSMLYYSTVPVPVVGTKAHAFLSWLKYRVRNPVIWPYGASFICDDTLKHDWIQVMDNWLHRGKSMIKLFLHGITLTAVQLNHYQSYGMGLLSDK